MIDITVEELKTKLDNKEDFTFVDVREPYEYEEANLGARLIPLNNLPVMVETIDHDKELVVMCKSGARSNAAKHFLLESGFKNVRNMLGGIIAWQAKYD